VIENDASAKGKEETFAQASDAVPADPSAGARVSFGQDFKRFFLRGLAALLPTLITIWLMLRVWEFLWENMGKYLLQGISHLSGTLCDWGVLGNDSARMIARLADTTTQPSWSVQLGGVALAVVLVYIVGLVAGNFIGRAAWRLAEMALLRVPLLRAIYTAIKQVTDFVLADKSEQFKGSRVVAVEPHARGIWSIGLVTGPGLKSLSQKTGSQMLTVFIPSSPTAFSGYVLLVPQESVVELPITVEHALRMLVSGGVIGPHTPAAAPQKVIDVLRMAMAELQKEPEARESAASEALALARQPRKTPPDGQSG